MNPVCSSTDVIGIKPTRGDGTVPILSAERIGNGIDLNAPGALRFPFYGGLTPDKDVSHNGILANTDVHSYIMRILNGELKTAGVAGQQWSQQSDGSIVADAELPPTKPAYYIRITNSEGFSIADAFGRSTASSPDKPLGGNVPGITIYRLGDKSALAITAADQTFTTTLRVGAKPFTIELIKGTDTETTQAVRYQDLALPARVPAMIKTTPQGIENLRYDGNGDGTFESVVAPTVSVSGTTAQDSDPPKVDINRTAQQSNALVSITATDSGSGVKGIYYSLDGTNFQSYTSPLTLDPSRVSAVYVFTDDKVANRSGLTTYYLSNPIDDPAFFVRQHYADFLNRAPDTGGFNYWKDQIAQCDMDQTCIYRKRIDVSAAFFIELEFQQTGSVVYRLYKAAYDARPAYEQFMSDRGQLVAGTQLPQSTLDFANRFT